MKHRNTATALTIIFASALLACDRPPRLSDKLPEVELPQYVTSSAGLTFEAPRVGDPAPQALQVVSGGDVARPPPDVDIAYSGVTGWLSAEVIGSTAPYTIAVMAHEVPGMASGVHGASLSIGSGASVAGRLVVPVSYTLAPELVVTTSLPPFTPGVGDFGLLTRTFTVTNAGRGRLPPPAVTATSEGGWLSASVTGSAEPYTVVVHAKGYRELATGSYQGAVAVSAPAATSAPATAVSLQIGAPAMRARGSVAWNVPAGCPLPGAAAVTVESTGIGFLPVPRVALPSETAAWLSAEVKGTRAPYQILFSVNAVPPDAPHSNVAVVTADGAEPVTVPVFFGTAAASVTGTRATPSPLVIHMQAGTGAKATGILSVLTDGGCIPAPQVSYTYLPGELPWLSTAVSSAVQRHDVTLQASTIGMAPGSRRSLTLHLSSTPDGSNTPVYEEDVPLTVEYAGIEATGALSTGRWRHAAAALPDGKVLVTGGLGGPAGPVLASAELYDPAPGTFSGYPRLVEPRKDHGAVVLADGRAVVCGGGAAGSSWLPDLLTCEVSPGGGPWRTAAILLHPRQHPTLVPLGAGRILVVGRGDSAQGTPDAEVVDLASGSSEYAVGDYGERVRGLAAAALPGGGVLVAGASGRDAWLYDPGMDRWTRTGDMTKARVAPALLVLSDGRVLAQGGGDPSVTDAEVWDPGTGTWTPAGAAAWMYRRETLGMLGSGKVVGFNGLGLYSDAHGSVELFDPVTGTWSEVTATKLPSQREFGTVTALPDGRILFVGGATGAGAGSAEAFVW